LSRRFQLTDYQEFAAARVAESATLLARIAQRSRDQFGPAIKSLTFLSCACLE
jgi:hypothetical protein